MELDLSPRLAKRVYGGDGGPYYAWSPSELPMLRDRGNIGAAKLALGKKGFALPRYSDSAKVAYVLQGNGVAGIVLPESEEKVIAIKKGDAIALPFGVVTWWYNKEDTELLFSWETLLKLTKLVSLLIFSRRVPTGSSLASQLSLLAEHGTWMRML
ncbi:legumin type B-like [Juglans microcarpa x Juglans regia]|uniref:legumin type B-like n=1 Tax=Juglans microcarpa x Juglans regia TaxID=2249226 RepID=UPI001B7DB458|nr:legumin type B-like [Juglans microcarpa x Juglans regia]